MAFVTRQERASVANRLALAAFMGAAIHASIALPLGAQTLPGQLRDTTVVVMLGTGTPRPLPDASGPATAIVVGTRVFLVDAGSGVERRLAAANLPINGVTAAFIPQLQRDHVPGPPYLMFTSWVMGRTRPFPVYGPHGLAAMIDHFYAAFSEDIRIRTEGLEHAAPDGYRVTVHESGP